MHSFSIVTCSYNPKKEVFLKLISGIQKIISVSKNIDIEWIIVDNNSNVPITEDYRFQSSLKGIKELRILRESVPGLTAARSRGISEARINT